MNIAKLSDFKSSTLQLMLTAVLIYRKEKVDVLMGMERLWRDSGAEPPAGEIKRRHDEISELTLAQVQILNAIQDVAVREKTLMN